MRSSFLALAAALAFSSQTQAAQPARAAAVPTDYGKLPLSFEANRGQTASAVKFISHGNGYSLFLTGKEAVLVLSKGDPNHAKGTGFSPYIQHSKLGRALQVSENPSQPLKSTGFVKGHDFSRADKANQMNRALAPAKVGAQEIPRGSTFFAGSLAPQGNAADLQTDVVRMNLVGADPSAQVEGADPLPGTANYFIGNNPAQWRSNIPTYAKVRYAGIYPGIDLLYYGNQRQLEYDFLVAPHADPSKIRMRFNGAGRLKLSPSGDLRVLTADGEIDFRKPVVYQLQDGRPLPVSGRFSLSASKTVTFALGPYDRAKPLVIDPLLVFATYLGGSTVDQANAIAVDEDGNTYIAGYTSSTDFPVTPTAFQLTNKDLGTVFVTKLNAAGSALVYSTYLGGSYGGLNGLNTGEGYETANAIAVDAAGDAFVTGYTLSYDFPVTASAFQKTNHAASGEPIYIDQLEPNAFVTKLNPTGTALVYSTYLGGSGTVNADAACPVLAGDVAYALAVDDAGDAYLTGSTYSPDFPVTAGALQTQNAAAKASANNVFLTKLNPAGSALLYSTFLGGSGVNYILQECYGTDGDGGNALAIDSLGDVYVAGYAHSTDFPVTSGAFQKQNNGGSGNDVPNAFVAKVNPDATSLIYSTYLGGTGVPIIKFSFSGGYGDQANALAIDSAGNAYLAGFTDSTDFPVTHGAFQTVYKSLNTNALNGLASNAFAAKLNPTGTALVYSTYIGGKCADIANALVLSASGDVTVAGSTCSTNFPRTPNWLYQTGSGFVTTLNATGSALAYATLFAAAPNAMAADSQGNYYIAGAIGSATLPVTFGVFQPTYKGSTDPDNNSSNGFIAKLHLGVSPPAVPTVTSLSANDNPQLVHLPVVFEAAVSAKSGSAIPTGSVVFSVDGKQTASATLDSTGHAAYTVSTLSPGLHAVKAFYMGSANWDDSARDFAQMITRPASTPTFSPAPGTYTAALTVKLADYDSGGLVIYYTTNGETPTTTSPEYTSMGIAVAATTTIKAIATATGYPQSAVASATYTIAPPAPAPTFSPAAGTLTSAQTVKLADNATAGLEIYYTTNGVTPTTSSTKYTSAGIKVTATETIKAIAVAAGDGNRVDCLRR